MKKFFSAMILGALMLPASALALSGTGPRVTIEGEITAISISEQQLFDDEGAELTVLAKNGQTVNVVIVDETNIVTEGRSSTKAARPRDLRVGMYVRASGWRVGTDGITASLVVITNVESNPGLSGNGVITSLTDNMVTISTTNGTSVTYTIDADTEVIINYAIKGPKALSFVGKQALISLSPSETSRLKVLRITGEPEKKADRPAVRELRTTRYRRR